MTEIPTDEGKLYLATVLDLFSGRLLGCPTSLRPDAELAGQALKMAAATRGGDVAGVIFHTDRGLDLHCARVQPAVPAPADYPVDGPGRLMSVDRLIARRLQPMIECLD